MLENLIKVRYMVSTSSRDMAPRSLNPNVITILTEAITDQVVLVVNVVTVVLLINQKLSGIWKRMLQVPQEKQFFKALQKQ